MDGNQNVVVTDGWSNPASRTLYESRWPGEPDCQHAYAEGRQCGACSFYAALDGDWGLCAFPHSRHWLESVFEHFTCPAQTQEGWGPHSFTADPNFHCLCGGEGDYWRPLVDAVQQAQGAKPSVLLDRQDVTFRKNP